MQTAGAEGVMEPDEQKLMFQDVSFKETESKVQTAIQRDPFMGWMCWRSREGWMR